MRAPLWSSRSALVLACVASFALACSENTDPDTSPIAGLRESSASDSTGAPPPPPPNPASPGYVHGTVLGPSAPGAGNDSLNTAPRVAGVVITAYPRISPSSDDLGPAAASVTTGADGKFQFPTLPGGDYVVTFEPPAGSIYGGVYVSGPIHDKSHEWPWWVVLWKKS